MTHTPAQHEVQGLQEKVGWLRTLLERVDSPTATQADIDALRQALHDYPRLWQAVGNLASLAQRRMIAQMNDAISFRESVAHGLSVMRRDLGYERSPMLERLLIDQLLAGWLQMNQTQYQYTKLMEQSLSLQKASYWERKLTAAQGRYLRACESLARVRRLLRPRTPPLQVNIGGQQVNIAPAQPPATAPRDPGELVSLGEPRDLT